MSTFAPGGRAVGRPPRALDAPLHGRILVAALRARLAPEAVVRDVAVDEPVHERIAREHGTRGAREALGGARLERRGGLPDERRVPRRERREQRVDGGHVGARVREGAGGARHDERASSERVERGLEGLEARERDGAEPEALLLEDARRDHGEGRVRRGLAPPPPRRARARRAEQRLLELDEPELLEVARRRQGEPRAAERQRPERRRHARHSSPAAAGSLHGEQREPTPEARAAARPVSSPAAIAPRAVARLALAAVARTSPVSRTGAAPGAVTSRARPTATKRAPCA